SNGRLLRRRRTGTLPNRSQCIAGLTNIVSQVTRWISFPRAKRKQLTRVSMEIPYIVQPREDTGLYNAKVGIWLFLASEVMLFGALFSSYILLRVGAEVGTWPHGLLNIPIGTLNTIVLITSSVTVVLAWASLKMNQLGRFRLFQTGTVLLAMTFVVIKSFEYHDKFTH